ncbi:MAG: hypothetical protein HUJ71_01740, partial [Pseudobutyrivibrio sp.]|nr:hypothetical protein [Pseudobutyrivibrio sp.]
MNDNISMYRKVNYILSKEQKLLSVLILILTCIGSAMELLGVAVIIPVINLILSPEKLMNSSYIQMIPFLRDA